MPGIPKKLKATLLAAALAGGGMGGYQEMTRQTLVHLENIAYEPYYDVAGVLTVCVGHTGPDIVWKHYTHNECMDLLDSDLKPVYAAINRLVKVPLTDYQRTALATLRAGWPVVLRRGGQMFAPGVSPRRFRVRSRQKHPGKCFAETTGDPAFRPCAFTGI